MRRRAALLGGLGLVALSLPEAGAGPDGAVQGASPGLRLGEPEPFDFERLTARARDLAGRPYEAPVVPHRDLIEQIDYDVFHDIRFRRDHTLLQRGPGDFSVELFHPGRFFTEPVRVHLVLDGRAHEVRYGKDAFTFGPRAGFVADFPPDLGFAGFRVRARNHGPELLAFLGASYFRSPGELDQYGLSARGLAIDIGTERPEEFPRFSAFWIEPAPAGTRRILVHALLESPSLVGAFRMVAARVARPVTMEIEARLFARRPVTRLGVAPMSSMFWYGESNRHVASDWRPEVHDSDGLAIRTGRGEHLWRPLNNPWQAGTVTSSFLDDSPRGFGLMQRDRDFENYQDTAAFYDRRPSLWVEPLDDWGPGAVQLLEIPTDDESEDNIAAWWAPEAPLPAGAERTFRYRLHWRNDEPDPPEVARVTATRISRGGAPGRPVRDEVRKFVVDFAGGLLEELAPGAEPTAEVTASRGRVELVHVMPVAGTRRWRAVFDLVVAGEAPVELRLHLRAGGRALTELWLYQYLPFEFPPPFDR
ncbi:MAG TPA: glucan biosynthesis protein [Geminicoccaceae bacterium]|nr:glucan biosynthesis protein [Geminicoccaceae bacterium]